MSNFIKKDRRLKGGYGNEENTFVDASRINGSSVFYGRM